MNNMKTTREIIDTIMKKMDENYNYTFNDFDSNISEVIELTQAYKEICKEIEHNDLVDEIISDIFTALYANLNGLYRHSYISLRCAIELSVALLQFNDNSYAYLKWEKDNKDIIWSNLIDGEYPILKKEYINLFYEPKSDRYELVFRRIQDYYRQCSEFVHGKIHYIYDFQKARNEYNKRHSSECFDMMKNILNSLIVLYALRFGNKPQNRNYEIINNCLKEYGEHDG